MPATGLSNTEVESLFLRYGALLERRCRLLLRDPTSAEDALQELLAMLLRRGEGLRQAHSPYRWLCRAADRTCLDLLRRGKHVRTALPIDELDPIGPAPGVDAEARCVALQSLATLDSSEQALAIMLFVDGLSQGEAAAELGVSRVTVNKRAHLLRSRLRIADNEEPEKPTEAVP